MPSAKYCRSEAGLRSWNGSTATAAGRAAGGAAAVGARGTSATTDAARPDAASPSATSRHVRCGQRSRDRGGKPPDDSVSRSPDGATATDAVSIAAGLPIAGCKAADAGSNGAGVRAAGAGPTGETIR